MLPEFQKCLEDALSRAIRIHTRMSKLDQASYEVDADAQDIAHWNFAVIGEALNNAKKIDEAAMEQITDWRRIINFRNQVLHGYGSIRNSITERDRATSPGVDF